MRGDMPGRMRTENVHTLILGAGPAGLACGYTLAKGGFKPVILDREKVPGGLMRSINHGDFVVDIGRKELYNRLAKVDDFWEGVIGSDYREYPHRGGYLYGGYILEMSRSYRSFRRGMPWGMFLGCITGFVWSRLNVFAPSPRNVEEYFYRTRGRLLTRVASQGFQEKLEGRRWADISLPENFSNADAGFLPTIRAAMSRALSTREVNTNKGIWRHPAKGTGQICDALAKGITDFGGVFGYGAKILGLKLCAGCVESVSAEIEGEKICYRSANVVSSLPLELMIPMLGRKIPEAYAAAKGAPSQRRTVVLVYLFLARPPKFPHAWLQVTDQSTMIGRITNYSGFNADMVPPGKGALCCEYYCFETDPLLEKDSTELARETVDYCVSSGLIDRESMVDNVVLKFPGADASQNRHNWITSMRLGLLEELAPFKNLYYVGRTDLDIATLAGIESAEAILSGDRTTFDRHFDPTQLGIRSEGKAFEFKLPV
jgi:protoporphyrinogen oxidase